MNKYINRHISLGPYLVNYFKKNRVPDFLENWELTFMGRDALKAVSNGYELNNDKKILFPCYTCDEAVTPLQHLNLDFYNISLPDFRLPIDDLLFKIEKENISAIVVIDYFGQIDPRLEQLYEACVKNGVLLIEDCSHSLFSKDVGVFSHATITSLRKLFPVPDGGAFKINHSTDFKPVAIKNSLISNLAAALIISLNILRLEELNLNRRHFEKFLPFLKKSEQGKNSINKPSFFCKKMLSKIDIKDLILERRKRYSFWQVELKGLDIESISSAISEKICPLGFPVLFKSLEIRANIHKYLSKRGVHIKIHWPVPDCVPSGFETPKIMADRSMTLPVFPELSWQKMRYISQLLLEAGQKYA